MAQFGYSTEGRARRAFGYTPRLTGDGGEGGELEPPAYAEVKPEPSLAYPSPAAGKANAVRHTNASNYLTVPYDSALIPNTGALTVEWRGVCNGNSGTGSQPVIELPYGTTFGEPFYVYAVQLNDNAATRSVTGQVNIGGTRRFATASNVPEILTGTPLHLAMTYDGSTIRLYVNGREVASASFAGTIQTSNQPLYLGRHGNTTTGYLDLTTDMVRIWSVVRTEAELAANIDQEIDPDTEGLSAYWKMNEGSGTAVADEVGSNDMTLIGPNTAWVDSLVWDGSNNERTHFPTVLELPNPYSTIQVIHPSVVYIPGGFNGYSWWAAYTPFPAEDASKENPCIAASHDGLTWEVPAGLTNPVSTPASGYDHSDTNLLAVEVSGTPTLWCYFREASEPGDANGDETVYRMESTDGVTWSNKTAVLSDASGTNRDNLMSPTVFWDGDVGEWVMLTVNNTEEKVQRRTSADGLTWSAEADVTLSGMPVGTKPWHLEARPDPSTGDAHVVMQVITSAASQGRIYYGVSDDAGATIALTGTPITSAKHAVFARGEYRASLVFDPVYEDRVHLYMSGYRTVTEIYSAKFTRRLASGDLYQENAGPL